MILITGFIIAVVLIALAVVMNAAIYTENLATRSESSGATDATAYQRSLEQGALEVFEYAHEVNASGLTGTARYDAMERNVTQAVTDLSEMTTRQQIRQGHIPDVSVLSVTDGARIWDDTGDFDDESGAQNWTLASGIDEVRNFRMEVTKADLNASDDKEFRVVVRPTAWSDRWFVNVSENTSTGKAEIGVYDRGSYTTCTQVGDSQFWINVTEGTVAGEECAALDFGVVQDAPHALEFRNGSAVGGTYTVVVEDAVRNLNGNAPNYDRVLYSTTLGLVYRTRELDYRSTIEIAPGEPDE